jgi:hypothetical protein
MEVTSITLRSLVPEEIGFGALQGCGGGGAQGSGYCFNSMKSEEYAIQDMLWWKKSVFEREPGCNYADKNDFSIGFTSGLKYADYSAFRS